MGKRPTVSLNRPPRLPFFQHPMSTSISLAAAHTQAPSCSLLLCPRTGLFRAWSTVLFLHMSQTMLLGAQWHISVCDWLLESGHHPTGAFDGVRFLLDPYHPIRAFRLLFCFLPVFRESQAKFSHLLSRLLLFYPSVSIFRTSVSLLDILSDPIVLSSQPPPPGIILVPTPLIISYSANLGPFPEHRDVRRSNVSGVPLVALGKSFQFFMMPC